MNNGLHLFSLTLLISRPPLAVLMFLLSARGMQEVFYLFLSSYVFLECVIRPLDSHRRRMKKSFPLTVLFSMSRARAVDFPL